MITILENNKLPYQNHFNSSLLNKNALLRRFKRQDERTLVEATMQKDYDYWLSQEDIADIARMEYSNFAGRGRSNTQFEILGSLAQLYITSEKFQLHIQANKLDTARLSLIINLDNLHWVTLVITYQHGEYTAYYVDSKNSPIPSRYHQMLRDTFHIQPLSLSPGFIQQLDEHNCGLWALQNTALLNQMIDQYDIPWMIKQLKIEYSKQYFEEKRIFFAEALWKDGEWRRRHSSYFQNLSQKKTRKLPDTPLVNRKFNPKKIKLSLTEKEKVNELLETFVELFLSAFIKKLSLYHLLAKGESLTEEALKAELKTGITGALLGVSIALSLVGSIPSLVASIRSLSNKYFLSKTKAQQITKIFSAYKSDNLRSILSEAAVNIFYSFESQFMQVTDEAGDKMAIERLAEDAVGRLLNGITKLFDEYHLITKELIERSILLPGTSESFFKPNLKRAQLTIPGYVIQSKNGKEINTRKLYERTGLIEFFPNGQPRKYYALKNYPDNKYGYRRLLNWEKKSDGSLKQYLKTHYFEKEYFEIEEVTQIISRNYQYSLDGMLNEITAKHILNKIVTHISSHVIPNKEIKNKPPIYFELRKPVINFSGRSAVLEKLHATLISEMTTAIVPAWSRLSISPLATLPENQSPSLSSGSQLSITGLGGIGKTQLALRYAEVYAEHYDHNVLWIDSETKENLSYSFNKLARKLNISIKDHYGLNKSLEEITEEIYEYFSDRKSLFIFDNVENYRSIEDYFPKSRPGNKPTVLITSRYTNWSNIATIITLPVFTEFETIELIQKSLHLAGIQSNAIKELNQLLQGLPLALQQAIAYIKLRHHTNPNFSIKDYIQLFKIKEKELLNFNYFDYSNDSYLKTVFTTWLVTLDKIKTEKLGQTALNILNIMAYLYPDYLSKSKLYYLTKLYENLELSDIDQIIHLLTSYSMLNLKDESSYMIHRLTQQTLRINIESDLQLFQTVVSETQVLIWHWNTVYKKNEDTLFHYMHFSLYMSEHKDLIDQVVHGHPEKNFFDSLTLQNLEHCQYFIDLAYLKFPKNKFLTFLGKGMSYYTKLGYYFHLHQIITYLISQWNKKNLSRENIKYMLEYIHHLENPIFKLKRFSNIKEKKSDQRSSVKLFYAFVSLVFGQRLDLYDDCTAHSLKRSLCLSEEERNKFKALRKSQLKIHFEKIGLVSRYISAALMTKDTFSALLQGHFDEVALNLGLITGSTFFGEISNRLFIQGKDLVSDATLLEKNLNLKNKKVLQILLNKDILSAGKLKFIGKLMQIASPFIALTPVVVAYNLKNEILAYKTGNKDVLPNIVSNSIIVSVEGIQAVIKGAEFLEIIMGVAVFTGPIGEWIALLAWISTDAYVAHQQLDEIEKYVHLSRGEKSFNFLLAMLHQDPLEYIQIKANNGQRIENAINFLKNNTAIQSYIFPSSAFSEDLYNTRIVFLNEKISFAHDDSNPDKPDVGDLFCLAAAPPPYDIKEIPSLLKTINGTLASSISLGASVLNPGAFATLKFLDYIIANRDASDETLITAYLCHKALGISYPLNRTGNATFINLGEGDDEIIAFPHSPNFFILQNGKKYYKGGDAGNVFDLSGNFITGRLQGGKGSDVLLLNNFHTASSDYILLDSTGSLCGKNDSSLQYVPPLCFDNNKIQINTIDKIYGRKNEADIIYLDRHVSFIDGDGGKNKTYPDNFFISEQSKKNLKIILRNNTLISFLADIINNTVDYSVPVNEVGNTWIQYNVAQSIQHRLFFEYSLEALETLTVENNTLSMSVLAQNQNDETKKSFSITFSVLSHDIHQTNNRTPLFQDIHYCFNDMGLKLINNNSLYGQEILTNNKKIDEKISFFTALANRLEKSFSIQLLNNVSLSIGRENKHEIFYINSCFESHLVGNGGENVYIIVPGKETRFPLPKLTLYGTSQRDSNELFELIDTLDLREMVKHYQQSYPHSIISSHVFSSENDLILTLSNSVYSPHPNDHYNSACFLPWLTIQLKDALDNNSNWYQKLDIILEIIPKNIAPLDEDFWILKSAPLIFSADKKIIFITEHDIEKESTLLLLRNIGNFSFFRDDMDLVLTNALESSVDFCTIICSQFYEKPEMKKKILSSTFEFFDHILHLQDYQKEIESTAHFQHLSQLFLSDTNDRRVQTYLNSLDILSPSEVNQEQLPQVRRKRQVKQENKQFAQSTSFLKINHFSESSRTSEKDRILAIADDYLNKYDQAHSKNKTYRPTKSIKQKKNKEKTTRSLVAIQKKSKPVIEPTRVHSKNKNKEFKYKTNDVDQNKTTLVTKLPKEKQAKIPFNDHSMTLKKENFYNHFKFNRKNSFFTEKPFRDQGNLITTTKTTSIALQLTYQKDQSGSKKTNLHPAASYTEQPNFHNTLLFIDFIAKAYRGRPTPLSYNKKLNKAAKKAIEFENKIKSDIFRPSIQTSLKRIY